MLPDKHACNVYDDITRCKAPPPNLNSANIFSCSVWGQTAKFKDCQYLQLYGSHILAKHVCNNKIKQGLIFAFFVCINLVIHLH